MLERSIDRSLTAMDSPIPLDSRKEQILKAVVSDYTVTGIPVGSHALAMHLASWSAATIRNELATLVEVGYLIQPHTSAGRVPSDRGYRYYIDFLMEEEALPGGVRRQLEPRLALMPSDIEGILETAAQVLATAVDALSIVSGPQTGGATVKHLDLVSLDPGHALLVLVLEGNLVRQHPLGLPRPADQDELSRLATRLNAELAGLNADQVESRRGGDLADPLQADVLSDISAFLRSVESHQGTLIVHDGVRNLLHQPEFGDVQRLAQVLEIVEQERILAELLAAAFDPRRPVTVMVGGESGIAQLRSCSLVLTSYRAGPDRRGTVGVLGPTRMPYAQVAPRVRFVADRVGAAVARVLS
ncbi:MAG TPA: heat-inducible transcriptional repressor HrcA [Candidatus Binatia bacterium]|nr:heat-inducible transcriptional repressor HrcA [Candidatus Binatia bacterium]